MFWALVIVALMTLVFWVAGCSYPLRFDRHRQDLEWKQKQCLDQGGSPEKCRP